MILIQYHLVGTKPEGNDIAEKKNCLRETRKRSEGQGTSSGLPDDWLIGGGGGGGGGERSKERMRYKLIFVEEA